LRDRLRQISNTESCSNAGLFSIYFTLKYRAACFVSEKQQALDEIWRYVNLPGKYLAAQVICLRQLCMNLDPLELRGKYEKRGKTDSNFTDEHGFERGAG
jgi:hypothetical protein